MAEMQVHPSILFQLPNSHRVLQIDALKIYFTENQTL
jgi:hypothetical protein